MVDDGHGQHSAPSSNNAHRQANHSSPRLTDERADFSLGPLANQSSPMTSEADKMHRQPLSTMFPASKESVRAPLMSQAKFHWDQAEQGHILGAFFYGYILFQIPGARMAELVGAKWIILAATAGSALISLLFPLSTQLNSIYLLMALRFVMGLCQSAFFPAAYVLFCRWLPEKERSVLLPIMFIGSNFGSISTYILSSYLISSAHGWPSVFYMSGLVCALVALLWASFGSNGPQDNWLITPEESRFIERNVNNQTSESSSLDDLSGCTDKCPPAERALANGALKKSASCCAEMAQSLERQQRADEATRANNYKAALMGAAANGRPQLGALKGASQQAKLAADAKQAPSKADERELVKPAASELSWPKLIKSVPVWTLILSMYGNEWSNVVICYELPTYLNTALSFPIEQNGVINSFFQLTYLLASPVMSSLGAYMLDKHVLGMRKIHVRKLFQSLATFGQLVCFVSVPICGANRGLIIMFMFSAILFKTCANAGDIMVPGDLSPEYAGTIFAFANSIGNTAGFFVPLLAGAFVHDAYEREQWTSFWLTTGVIMATSGLIFLFLGETKLQDFSPDRQEDLEAENKGAKQPAQQVALTHRAEKKARE